MCFLRVVLSNRACCTKQLHHSVVLELLQEAAMTGICCWRAACVGSWAWIWASEPSTLRSTLQCQRAACFAPCCGACGGITIDCIGQPSVRRSLLYLGCSAALLVPALAARSDSTGVLLWSQVGDIVLPGNSPKLQVAPSAVI